MVTLLVCVHPLSSVIVNVYVPAERLLIVRPVCPFALGLQVNVNGGSPSVINADTVPSPPITVLVPTNVKSIELDAGIINGSICWQKLASVTVAV